MKALSLHPLWAGLVFTGEKNVECRTWNTSYRGEILICSTRHKLKDTIPGHALCTVKLVDVVPFTRKHMGPACMDGHEMPENAFAWILDDLKLVRPFPVKGKLGLWEYSGDIEYLPIPQTDEEDERQYHEIWEPLFT